MFKLQSNLNRSGRIGSGKEPAPILPGIAELQPRPQASLSALSVRLTALADNGRLQLIGFEQLSNWTSGSVFAIFCDYAGLESWHMEEMYFMCQLVGVSPQFTVGKLNNVRTIAVRSCRRPGQLGPYYFYEGNGDVQYINVRDIPKPDGSEYTFLPAVRRLLPNPASYDAQATIFSVSATDLESLEYRINAYLPKDPPTKYHVPNGAVINVNRLALDPLVSLVGDLSCADIPFGDYSAPSGLHRMNYPLCDLLALAKLEDPAHPGSFIVQPIWSCVYKPADSFELLVKLYLPKENELAVVPSVDADASKSEQIINFKELAYSRI